MVELSKEVRWFCDMTAIGQKLLVWEEEAVECEERDDGERWKWWN